MYQIYVQSAQQDGDIMKPRTRAELEKLEHEFYEYGVTVDALADQMDTLPYAMPDSEAVLLYRALLTHMYFPERMTPELERPIKHYLNRRKIKLT